MALHFPDPEEEVEAAIVTVRRGRGNRAGGRGRQRGAAASKAEELGGHRVVGGSWNLAETRRGRSGVGWEGRGLLDLWVPLLPLRCGATHKPNEVPVPGPAKMARAVRSKCCVFC